MSPRQIETILAAIYDCYDVVDDVEISLESNPGAVDAGKLSAFRSAGINRLSIGVQSFIAEELHFLNRIHTAEQAIQTFNDARCAGFDNINVDLMFAVPVQSIETWASTLERACELSPEHISAYSLIYEKGTPLFEDLIQGKFAPIDEDTDAGMYETTFDILSKSGFERYEVSNYAKPGKRCRHNLIYWQCGEYLGFGPSANGHIGGARYWNFKNIDAYISAVSNRNLPVEGNEILTEWQQIEEAIMLGLRSTGINTEKFRSRFGIDLPEIINLTFARKPFSELIMFDGEKIYLSTAGYVVSDRIISLITGYIQDTTY
jgi:oxygen-independent coproporphyrinogen-3 oxidase